VGENFGGGLFSTSPENLVTYFHCAGLLEDWNCRTSREPALARKNIVFSEICILEENFGSELSKIDCTVLLITDPCFACAARTDQTAETIKPNE
jgi:hypothetical protein